MCDSLPELGSSRNAGTTFCGTLYPCSLYSCSKDQCANRPEELRRRHNHGRSGVNSAARPRVGLAIRVARADAFAKIDKFRDRRSKGGLWERVTPLSCKDCADLERQFEAYTGLVGDRSSWNEEMCNRWTGMIVSHIFQVTFTPLNS